MKKPNDYYFGVHIMRDSGDTSGICLSDDGSTLDDQLGSHNVGQLIIDALNKAGIFGDAELMEAMWEVNNSETKTKEEIIKSMQDQGFIYEPRLDSIT